MRLILILGPIQLLLQNAQRWHPPWTTVPSEVQDLVNRCWQDCDLPDCPDPLRYAVGQLYEDFRALKAKDLNSHQPDGSPSPRLWASLRLLAERYCIVAGVSDPAGMIPAFEARQKRHRIALVNHDDEEEESSIWADRAALRARVLELSEQGLNCTAIADRLRQGGVNIGSQAVSAIVGHLRKKRTRK